MSPGVIWLWLIWFHTRCNYAHGVHGWKSPHYGAKPVAICLSFRAVGLLHLSYSMNLGHAACITAWDAFHVTARWRVWIRPRTFGTCHPSSSTFAPSARVKQNENNLQTHEIQWINKWSRLINICIMLVYGICEKWMTLTLHFNCIPSESFALLYDWIYNISHQKFYSIR